MKHFSLAAFSFALFLAACGDDSSSVSADNPSSEVDSSSSIVSDDSKESSDSKSNDKVSSSSSVKKVESSSSEKKTDSEKSSSSEKSSGDETKSSSSEETTSSSSEAESSSSLAGSVYDADKKTLTDNRDGQVYKTVTIGDQIWMAENLNYADSSETPSLKGKSWCFDNDTAKCTSGGRLYTWAAAIDSVKLAAAAENPLDCGYGKACSLEGKVQGICPESWHLPDTTEWHKLFTAVGGQSTAGKMLKSATGWEEGNGSDDYSFSALPVGWRDFALFNKAGQDAVFWSATEKTDDTFHTFSYIMELNYNNEGAYLGNDSKDYGFSVRCVKDAE